MLDESPFPRPVAMNQGTQPTGGAIRVGDFVVDPRSGELRGEAGRQVLSAQPLHVLVTLAERPGELVTRDELQSAVLPTDVRRDNRAVLRIVDAGALHGPRRHSPSGQSARRRSRRRNACSSRRAATSSGKAAILRTDVG